MTARAPGPRRHCAVEFRAFPSRIGQVRRIVAAQLRYWRLAPLIDPVTLGVTELLANVHRHAGPDKHCTVELVLLADRVAVSVRDHGAGLPSVRAATETESSGRGMALVAAVSDTWGTRAQGDGAGKAVWFTVPVATAPTAQRPGTAPEGAPTEPRAEQQPEQQAALVGARGGQAGAAADAPGHGAAPA